MKKLLLLGGSRFAMPVIETAHRLDCRVITCDYLPDNYAHRYSDQYCNASVVDFDAVLDIARAQHIDAVMSFACDPGVVTAAYVAEKLGLPSPGPLESVRILQNKGLFRRFLEENGFNTPTSGTYRSAEDALRDADRFQWPVMVKPVDSAGSKGVTRLEGPEGLREAAARALAFSRAGTFIVEYFIESAGCASDSDGFFADGALKCVYFDCQRFDPQSENPYVPAAYHWPSTLSDAQQAELASGFQRLLRLLRMGDSIYNLEARADARGRTYIMECAPRGGGNRLAECIELAAGVPLIENAVRAALGLPLVDLINRPIQGHWAEIILHSQVPGRFKNLWLDPGLSDAVVQRDLWVEHGTPVGGFRSAGDALGTLILRFDSESALRAVMDNPGEYVRVEVIQ